jgi:hypothetical protein
VSTAAGVAVGEVSAEATVAGGSATALAVTAFTGGCTDAEAAAAGALRACGRARNNIAALPTTTIASPISGARIKRRRERREKVLMGVGADGAGLRSAGGSACPPEMGCMFTLTLEP